MKTKLLLVLATVAAVLFGFAPMASATPTVLLKPGDGWTDSGSNGFCSFAAFGRDSAGRLVGLTAGHCRQNASYTNIYKHGETAAGVIGQLTNVYQAGQINRGTLDYAAVVLDETKVAVKNEYVNEDTGATVQVTSIDAPPTGMGNVGSFCMVGHNSEDCATMGYKNDGYWVQTYTAGGPGDSGGGLFNGSKFAGIYTGITFDFPPHVSSNAESVVAALTATGSYGAGFTLYNTP